MSINTITLSGRLVAAPELRYTTNGIAVSSGCIAVDDGYGEQKKTYFLSITHGTILQNIWPNTQPKAHLLPSTVNSPSRVGRIKTVKIGQK